MQIGTVKEIKPREYRVALAPSCVKAYTNRGHEVMVEKGAGENAGFADSEYAEAGATITTDKQKIFEQCQMLVKAKEPTPDEYDSMRPGQILYTYLHLAASKSLTLALTDVTLGYGMTIAEHGLEQACQISAPISKGVNLYLGKCVYENVADDLGLDYDPLESVLQ